MPSVISPLVGEMPGRAEGACLLQAPMPTRTKASVVETGVGQAVELGYEVDVGLPAPAASSDLSRLVSSRPTESFGHHRNRAETR